MAATHWKKWRRDDAWIALINRKMPRRYRDRLESKSFRHQLGLLAHFRCLYYRQRWSWRFSQFPSPTFDVAIHIWVSFTSIVTIHYYTKRKGNKSFNGDLFQPPNRFTFFLPSVLPFHRSQWNKPTPSFIYCHHYGKFMSRMN